MRDRNMLIGDVYNGFSVHFSQCKVMAALKNCSICLTIMNGSPNATCLVPWDYVFEQPMADWKGVKLSFILLWKVLTANIKDPFKHFYVMLS